MKDFKQNTKMSASGSHYCGGGKVKKYADGGAVSNTLEQTQAESRRMQREGVPVNPTPEQQPAATMTRIANYFSNKSSAPAEMAPRRSSRMEDAAAELQRKLGPDVIVTPSQRAYKRGGKVKRGKK